VPESSGKSAVGKIMIHDMTPGSTVGTPRAGRLGHDQRRATRLLVADQRSRGLE
jgi:hypothetical protein